MPLSEARSHTAILVWALTWLPGLPLACWRAERLLRARQAPRALLECAAILLLPLLAFGLYAVSGAQRYAQAGGEPVSWRSLLSVGQPAVPYLASMACLLLLTRRAGAGPGRPTAATRWWVAFAVGLLAIPVLVPGLLMAQLMVFVGA